MSQMALFQRNMTLGIDIGGTNIRLGLVEDGSIVKAVSVPSFRENDTLDQTLEYLCTQIRNVFNDRVEKIGIGVPSVVDVRKGVVYDTANIPSWKEVRLKEHLERVFAVPVSINNDANCFAMGVYGKYPSGSKPDTLVVITLGTGVGLGVIDNGRLFCGANCGAGELCCVPYLDSVLEDYCSKKFFTRSGWETRDAGIRAAQGDEECLGLFREFGKHVGAIVCHSMFAFDPSHIVLAGGIANNFPYFEDSLRGYVREHFPYRRPLERLTIETCTDDDLPVIGASMI